MVQDVYGDRSRREIEEITSSSLLPNYRLKNDIELRSLLQVKGFPEGTQIS